MTEPKQQLLRKLVAISQLHHDAYRFATDARELAVAHLLHAAQRELNAAIKAVVTPPPIPTEGPV